ncbi:MAG: type 1 glutamine amidotransferase [Gammaproteobacteria bacterium]|nr:type 1 glutamine amidotransferase [Gammaproteobacteria bacterium]
MKPLVIFRHAPGEGPGYLSDVLRRRGVPFELICVDQGQAIPDTVDDWSGLVFMGGPMSVNDPLPWIDQVTSLIRAARERDVPVLGHCLGGQLISKALGGTVTSNPVQEIGWGPVTQMANAGSRRYFAALPTTFEVFHWHGETFSIPDGATLVLTGPYCRHQGFVIGRMLGLQCHIEMTAKMIENWINNTEGRPLTGAASVQTAEAMRTDMHQRLAALHRVADAVYGVWLDQLCA